MTPATFVRIALDPGLSLLPPAMDSREARVMIVAACYQESGLRARVQYHGGPARGFAQFELGQAYPVAGVWALHQHVRTRVLLWDVCDRMVVGAHPVAVHEAMTYSDALTVVCARLLLWADPHPLPRVGDERAAWECYLRCWRPGKPRPEKWADSYRVAVEAVPAEREVP